VKIQIFSKILKKEKINNKRKRKRIFKKKVHDHIPHGTKHKHWNLEGVPTNDYAMCPKFCPYH
jgi:hypothetical protein